jgi:hypothetical protein
MEKWLAFTEASEFLGLRLVYLTVSLFTSRNIETSFILRLVLHSKRSNFYSLNEFSLRCIYGA